MRRISAAQCYVNDKCDGIVSSEKWHLRLRYVCSFIFFGSLSLHSWDWSWFSIDAETPTSHNFQLKVCFRSCSSRSNAWTANTMHWRCVSCCFSYNFFLCSFPTRWNIRMRSVHCVRCSRKKKRKELDNTYTMCGGTIEFRARLCVSSLTRLCAVCILVSASSYSMVFFCCMIFLVFVNENVPTRLRFFFLKLSLPSNWSHCIRVFRMESWEMFPKCTVSATANGRHFIFSLCVERLRTDDLRRMHLHPISAAYVAVLRACCMPCVRIRREKNPMTKLNWEKSGKREKTCVNAAVRRRRPRWRNEQENVQNIDGTTLFGRCVLSLMPLLQSVDRKLKCVRLASVDCMHICTTTERTHPSFAAHNAHTHTVNERRTQCNKCASTGDERTTCLTHRINIYSD